ncbi:hypothetical protein MUP59_07570, partial [Candidatus Bathyarchaeota archaeon]|nr:hypothetical protein [Candidatus Bathyarchaeota archaeon]
ESRFMKRYQDQQKKDDKTNFIDKRKLDEDSTRFRLQAEEQRITATGQMRALALQNERAGAIAAAKLTSESTFLIEQQFDRKLAEESLRSALEVLNVKQKAELAETVKTGMSAAVINQKYLDERLLAYQKFSTDVGKLDAERQTMINEAHRKAVFLQFGFLAEGELPEVPTPAPTGRQQGEADARSRARDLDRQRRIEDWRSQLVEVSNDYDSITASQVKSLEEQRRIYLLTEEGMLLWGEELEAYNKLTAAKVAEIKVTRELNKEQTLVKLRQQVFELQGSWIGMKNAEIEALEIEKQITLATDKLTDSQRELIEQVYTLRKAEVQAAKDMNVSELMKIGMKEMSIKANRDLADTFKNILPDSIHSFGNTFREFLKTGVMDFKSFTESLRDIWGNVLTKMAEKWLTDFLEKTVMSGGGGGGGGIFGFIKSLFGGGGGGGIETFPELINFQEGGRVPGSSGQPVSAMLHAKEFVQPESSVSYYGSGAMEAIRRQIIPRGLLQGFFSGRPLTPSFAFQTGGLVEPNISRSISSLVKVDMGNKWNEAKLQDTIERAVVKVLKSFI